MKGLSIVFMFMSCLLVSGCVDPSGESITELVTALPAVQAYLDAHPDADVTVTAWSESMVTDEIDTISEKCDVSMPIQAYYRVKFVENNMDVTMWLDKSTNELLCMYKEGSGTNYIPIEEDPQENTESNDVFDRLETTVNMLAADYDTANEKLTIYLENVGTTTVALYNAGELSLHANVGESYAQVCDVDMDEVRCAGCYDKLRPGETERIVLNLAGTECDISNYGADMFSVMLSFDNKANVGGQFGVDEYQKEIFDRLASTVNWLDADYSSKYDYVEIYIQNVGDTDIDISDNVTWIVKDDDGNEVCHSGKYGWGYAPPAELAPGNTRTVWLPLDDCDLSEYQSGTRMRATIFFGGQAATSGTFEIEELNEQQFSAKSTCINLCKEQLENGVDMDDDPCLSELEGVDWEYDAWVCDVAHMPRVDADNDANNLNQCQNFLSGEASHFIEVSPYCEVIRVM